MSARSGADQTAFGLLTETHTLLVLDTETAPAADGGPQRVIQIGTVPVTLGRRGRVSTRLVNPREPITNSHIHGITDADVAGKPGFAVAARALDAVLTAPGVVLVAHYAAYDVNVLRGEYERLGRPMPDVPVVDTIALARYVAHDTGRSSSLVALTRSLNITFSPAHDAGKDAEATAKALVALLRLAGAAGLVSLEDILADIGSTTATLPEPVLRPRPAAEPEPALAADHLATHSTLLPEQPAPEQLESWVAAALECVQLRCPLARDRAAAAASEAPDYARVLLDRLADPALLTDLEAGQAGTHAAFLHELVPAALGGGALNWWRTMRPHVAGLERCHRGTSGPRCADCREGRPCPLDTLHQAASYAECRIQDGRISNQVMLHLTGSGESRGVFAWARRGDRDVAGYTAWLIYDFLSSGGVQARASATLDRAVISDLHTTEPRLALAYAQTLALQGRVSEVDAVVQGCPRPAGNTDEGFDLLDAWVAGSYTELLARSAPARQRVRKLPRQARPEGRLRPNRLKY